MAGHFIPLERKSIQPIAISKEGDRVRAMQRFLSNAPLDDAKIIDIYRSFVNDSLGHLDEAIIFNESGFVKNGNDPIGIGRQYCGTIGKVDNCQVGAFVAYALRHGYTLIAKRIYVLKKWFSDSYVLNVINANCRLTFFSAPSHSLLWICSRLSLTEDYCCSGISLPISSMPTTASS